MVSLTTKPGVTLNNVKITKHTHEYHGRHMLYYHKLEAQFKKWSSSPPTYIFLNYVVNNVTDWYAKTLKNFLYCVVYGVKGWVDDIPDVSDGHPVLTKPKTAIKTQSVKHATKKESTVHPVQHGDQHPTAVYLYSNLTKSIFGTNEIFKACNYKHETGMLEFNPIHFIRQETRFWMLWNLS